MKTKSALYLSMFLFAGTIFAQTSGGPDTYGYTWKNDQEPSNPPVYKWKEIKGIGTQITGLNDDDKKGPFNIGWSFHYYWVDYTKFWMGANGWLSFQNNSKDASAPIPTIPNTSAPNNYLAIMCSDLTFIDGATPAKPVPGATAWYWSNSTDTLVLQYDSVPYWIKTAPGYDGRYSFQVILSGVDSSITYQYKLTQDGTTPYDLAGEGLTTGIENSTGQIGLQVLASVMPTANTAVKFYYPNPVTYQVFDATPAWNNNIENGGFFVSASSAALNLQTDVYNAGNQPLSNIVTTGELLNSTVTQVWDTVVTVKALAAGADSMFTYPKTYTPNTVGTYIYRSSAIVSGDINSANNITDVEMVVVDTTAATIPLNYVNNSTSPTGKSSWGGNGGQGVYIKPPFYPAVISSLDFMVTNSGTSGYHLVKVIDDDGAGNSPGTVLYLDSADASTAVIGSYNNVPVTKSVIIYSGGVYVGWFENGDASSEIGTESTPPLSNRNYEIIGSWSGYRNNEVDDIMIQMNITKYNVGNVAATSTPDACPTNGSGSATVTVTAGSAPPYTYLWTPGGQTTASVSGLAAGVYTVTITDSLGMSKATTVPVYSTTTVTAAATTSITSCYGGNDGAIAAAIAGTAPYTYLWSNGQTGQTATGLVAGSYTVMATNADGCFNTAIATIANATQIAATFSLTSESCAGNNGSATAIVTGGTGAYTYAWGTTPSQTTATATGLTVATYSLLVTDANGCTKSSTASISNIPFITSTSTTPISCFNGCDGTATASATSGGTAPYTFAWGTTPAQGTATATGLCTGISYSVLITDAAGCTSVKTITPLTNPTAVVANITSTIATTCATCPDGSATASGSGGTGPYTFSWVTTPVQNTAIATGLLPGTYTVCVTDSKGCSTCTTATVADGTGINELYTGASVVISPNPFNSSALVKIDFVNPTHNNLIFSLVDIYGREIQSIDLKEYKGSVIGFTLNRGDNIPNGMYFYRLEDEKEILSTGKLLVQ